MLKSWTLNGVVLPEEDKNTVYISKTSVLNVVFEKYCILQITYGTAGRVTVSGDVRAVDGTYRCFKGAFLNLTADGISSRAVFLGWYDEYGERVFVPSPYPLQVNDYELSIEARFTEIPLPPIVTIDGETAYWSAIAGAESYNIYIDGLLFAASASTEFDLRTAATVTGTYSIEIEALWRSEYRDVYGVKSGKTDFKLVFAPPSPTGDILFNGERILYMFFISKEADGFSIYVDGEPYLTAVYAAGWNVSEPNRSGILTEITATNEGMLFAADLTDVLSVTGRHAVYSVCSTEGKLSEIGGETNYETHEQLPEIEEAEYTNGILKWKYSEEADFMIAANGVVLNAFITRGENGEYIADLTFFEIPIGAEITLYALKIGYTPASVSLTAS
jgi:hypothetical protein